MKAFAKEERHRAFLPSSSLTGRAKVTVSLEANLKRVRVSYLVLISLLLLGCSLPSVAQNTSLSLSPAEGAKVRPDELTITVSISGPLADTLNLGTAKLFIDSKNVTAFCLRTDTFLSYRPFNTPPSGRIDARIEFANGVVREWTFDVLTSQLIQSVTHSATETLGEFEELTVTMIAAPSLAATYALGDKDTEHPMMEISPGLYAGTYLVRPGDYYLDESVTGLLHVQSRVEKKIAERPVTLFGHLFKVSIISPKSGSQVPTNFLLKGRTRPGSKISIVPKLSFQGNTRAPNTQSSRGGGNFETTADEKGYFEVTYGVPMKLPNLSVVLSVFAVTPDGERSVPVILRYKF